MAWASWVSCARYRLDQLDRIALYGSTGKDSTCEELEGAAVEPNLTGVVSAIVTHRKKMRRVRGMTHAGMLLTAWDSSRWPRRRPREMNNLFHPSKS
jgi:hypothetical protein